MTRGLRPSETRDEQGFTLIELMVVVLIIAILLAIAIPTFLGARKRAQDSAAQTLLRNTMTAEKTYYTDTQAYTNGSGAPNPLLAIEPAIPYDVNTMLAPTTPGHVSLQVSADSSEVCLTAHSLSGATFTLADITIGANPGTWYSKAWTGGCTNAAVATAPAGQNSSAWK